MKTAICISGKVDFFSTSFESLRRNILDHNDCDIFIHTYASPIAERAVREMRPKSYVLEEVTQDFEIPTFLFNAKYPETKIENLFWMWRNISKCMSLVTDPYDAVIRTRFDIIYPEPLKLIGADFRSFWIPRGGDHRRGFATF